MSWKPLTGQYTWSVSRRRGFESRYVKIFIHFLNLGARQCPRQVEQKKAARPYHPFLEAIQAIFDPPITSLWIKQET